MAAGIWAPYLEVIEGGKSAAAPDVKQEHKEGR
jgi:hypothetical protein